MVNWLWGAIEEDANPTQNPRLDRCGRMRHKLPRRLPGAVISGKSKARRERAMGRTRKGRGSPQNGFPMRQVPAGSSLWEAGGKRSRGSLRWVGAKRPLDKESV